MSQSVGSDGLPELRIPAYRTRVMMKSSPDVDCVSLDSVLCLSKATELFIEELVSSACPKGHPFSYKQLSDVQAKVKRYAFLADVLPTKITAKEWMDKYKAEFEASL